ncbi:MAG TPA: hypothetical protein VN688_10620 [Gemmataceae bacterium]|nr:hypothetical protein [Gemmataceae bacterium]
MNNTPHIAARLHDMASQHNRELVFEGVGKALLGGIFSFITFGLLFWFGWFAGFFVAGSFGLQAWQFGALVTGLFLIVAMWSAWQRVDPLAGLPPLSDQQLLLTMISQASPNLLYFSPRHATAGAALLLLGGPTNLFEAFGVWGYRLGVAPSSIEEASHLLEACEANYPIEHVREPSAALLLKRLALIKIVPTEDSVALTLTEKGASVLSRAKARAAKRSTVPRTSKGK